MSKKITKRALRIACAAALMTAAAATAAVAVAESLPAAAPHAETTTAEFYRTLNVALAEEYILPRYRALAATARAQRQTLRRLCAAPTPQRLTTARQAFHAHADAWAAIQHIGFGPMSLAFRAERMQHWPERRNAVDKALQRLLDSGDAALLEPTRFASAGVEVQGLTALERLLFAGPATLAELTRPAADERLSRCALLQAVGDNLASISGDVLDEWRDDLLPTLTGGGGHPTFFETPRDASRQLLADFLAAVQTVAQLKLNRILGASAALTRPRLAENWRSGRAGRNIRINLDSVYAMYRQGFAAALADHPERAERLQRLFSAALDAAGQLPDNFQQALSDRTPFEQALTAISALRNRLREDVPQASGLHLGFTSFDGD